MPTGEQPFEEIAMDFVGELPESEGFNAILVVTDRFTKVQQYLPAKTTLTAADVANAYCNEIWRLHGLPRHISCDRGPQFAYKFTKELNRKLNINLRLSTTYHPQTDRLSERAVQTLEQYRHIYCHDRQNRWRACLLLAEFAYNTTTTTTQVYTPYRGLYGFDRRTIHLDDDYELSYAAAEEWLDRMPTVYNQIHDTLKPINAKRSTIHIEKARQFNIDDWVLVDRRNLQVKAGNNNSLTRKWLGPYKVLQPIGSHAYSMEVPEGTRWHNVVHTTLLKPFRRRDEPRGMDEDEAVVREVEGIVNSRTRKGVVQYRLCWAGCMEFEDIWETRYHLYNCTGRLKELRQKFPRKPQDKREVCL